MHKTPVRPRYLYDLPTRQSFPGKNDATDNELRSIHSTISCQRNALRTNSTLALLVGCLSIILSGCSGLVKNPATTSSSASSSASSPSLSAISCGMHSVSQSGKNGCSVQLSSAAVNPFVVYLSSNSSQLNVPASVTVSPGATSSNFDTVVAAIMKNQDVTLTASAGGVTQTFDVQLLSGNSTAATGLTVSATSLSFGDVVVDHPASLPLTITAGSSPVTINSATVAGAGFSVSNLSFPVTLSPGQMATLAVGFNPSAAGNESGELSIATDASTSGPTAVSLAGNGVPHEVKLTWDPPDNLSAVAGYHVYRSPAGASTFQLLSSSMDTQTSFVDATVQSGHSYDYLVKTIDSNGVESAPSNTTDVVVP